MHEREQPTNRGNREAPKNAQPAEPAEPTEDEIVLLEDLTPRSDVTGGASVFGEVPPRRSDAR